jgi:hypothetical protein
MGYEQTRMETIECGSTDAIMYRGVHLDLLKCVGCFETDIICLVGAR